MITTLATIALALAGPVAPAPLDEAVATALREQVRDPASIERLQVCEPFTGRSGTRSRTIFLSARNGFGGQSGLRVLVAVERDGGWRLVDPGLPLNEELRREMETCPRYEWRG